MLIINESSYSRKSSIRKTRKISFSTTLVDSNQKTRVHLVFARIASTLWPLAAVIAGSMLPKSTNSASYLRHTIPSLTFELTEVSLILFKI